MKAVLSDIITNTINLTSDDLAVHLSDRLGGFIRGAEAHKAEALRATIVHHHLPNKFSSNTTHLHKTLTIGTTNCSKM